MMNTTDTLFFTTKTTNLSPKIPDGFASLIRGKSVSLVGNSIASLRQEYGQKIDSADIVVRCNRGFQKCSREFKGLRTDILILGSPGKRGEYPLDFVKNLRSILWTKSAESGERLRDVSMELYSHPNLVIYDQEYRMFQRKEWLEDWWPTAGFMAFSYLYLSNPKRIDIYGFDFFTTGTSYHGRDRSAKWHNPKKEKEILLKTIQSDKKKRLAIHGYQST